MRTGDRAVVAGALAIVAYETLVADDEDLISRRVAGYRRRWPTATTAVVFLTALHLVDWLPTVVDPYHQALKVFR